MLLIGLTWVLKSNRGMLICSANEGTEICISTFCNFCGKAHESTRPKADWFDCFECLEALMKHKAQISGMASPLLSNCKQRTSDTQTLFAFFDNSMWQLQWKVYLHFSLLTVSAYVCSKIRAWVSKYTFLDILICVFRYPNNLSFSAVSMCSCKWQQGILF